MALRGTTGVDRGSGLVGASARRHGWARASVTGPFGSALSLQGGTYGSQYVWRPDEDVLTPAALTIDLWMNPSRLDVDNQMIVHKYQNGVPDNSDYILLLSNAELGFWTRGSEYLHTTLPAAGQWYHVTAIANQADSRCTSMVSLPTTGTSRRRRTEHARCTSVAASAGVKSTTACSLE